MAPNSTLTEDEIDDILYLARTNEAAELSSYLASLSSSHSASLSEILACAIDPYNKNTALHYAAANGHADILDLCTRVFHNSLPSSVINATNTSANTPLHWAALNGHLNLVKTLLSLGANAALINKSGYDAVFEAENAGKTEVVELLLRDAVGLEAGVAGVQGNGEGASGNAAGEGEDIVMSAGDTSGEGVELHNGLEGDEAVRKEVEKMSVNGQSEEKGKAVG